jgi:Fe-S-cluster containining protein
MAMTVSTSMTVTCFAAPLDETVQKIDELERANAAASETETYYNGGVSDQSLKFWYGRVFEKIWESTAIALQNGNSEEPAKPVTGGNLCSSCALCCDGTLFSSVPVSGDERDRLGDDPGLFVRGVEVRLRMKCSCLDQENRCKIYETRPKICRNYRCDLLKRTECSELSFSESEHIVREAKRLQLASIEAFARAMPIEFINAHFISAVDARNHYAAGRGKGVQVNEHLRKNAWLLYGAFKDYIRANFRQDFNPD